MIDRSDELRERIDHEDHLVSFRTNWVVMSQAFLLTAYGICTANSGTPETAHKHHALVVILPWVSVVTLVLLWLSILSGLKSIGRFRRELSGLVATPAIRWGGLAPSAAIPAVFLAMWAAVIVA